MTYEVLSEDETLAACDVVSISRFGDGELRCAMGGACSSQIGSAKLAVELTGILANYRGVMVGIPNFKATPNKVTWNKYAGLPFSRLYKQESYGSAFITRPDNAPWIDTPDYWARVRRLWEGYDITLVSGDAKSITESMLADGGAGKITSISAPRQHAFDQVDQIEEQIGRPTGRVILCLGATATVLAARLDRKGVHALDLGHIGMFMRHAGSYVPRDQLISPAYVMQNRILHEAPSGFGGDGKKHAERILQFATKIGARSIIDYGCGEGTLKAAILPLGWKGFFCEYDPGMPGPRQNLPKPAHLLACTDVLEHIEPDKLDAVLRHQFNVAEFGAWMSIATRPANKILPDGRNAHLIIETPQWWIDKLKAVGWQVVEQFEKTKDGKAREVWLWLMKPPKGSDTATT